MRKRHKFKCAVLTACTVPMRAKTLTATGRRHNEGVIRWKNIIRNLASRNAGRMILMDIEHELRAMDQARLTTDGIHFDGIEGQAWLNRVFQEQLDEMEVELFDTGVLKKEETTNESTISTFVPPNLEIRLETVPAVTFRPQSSSEPGQRTNLQDRLGDANEKNRPSKTKIRTCQSDRGDDQHLEIRDKIRDYGYQQRRATSRQELFDVVEAHTFSLARVQTRPDEFESSDSQICSRCHEDVKWSDSRGLADSGWHKLQLHERPEVCRLRGTALKQYNGSNKCKTIARCETESR